MKDHIFLIRPTTHTQKVYLKIKNYRWHLLIVSDVSYPYASSLESILAKSYARTHVRTLRYTKYGLIVRQVKVIGQWKPGINAPENWFKPLPECDSLSPPVCLSISTVLLFFLISICCTTSCLYENSYPQTWRTRALSVTTGQMASIQCSYLGDPTSVTGN